LLLTPAVAADDETLVRILARADIAHSLASYCAQFDSSILDRTTSSVGNIQSLMLHIRGEVVSDLPQAEALNVVVRSANAARAGALLAIRKLYGPDLDQERARLTSWCENSVVPSIKQFIAWHDDDHATFEWAIQRAKRNLGDSQGPGP